MAGVIDGWLDAALLIKRDRRQMKKLRDSLARHKIDIQKTAALVDGMLKDESMRSLPLASNVYCAIGMVCAGLDMPIE